MLEFSSPVLVALAHIYSRLRAGQCTLNEGSPLRSTTVLLAAIGALIVAGGAGFLAIAWKPEIAPITPPRRSSFDQAMIEHGAVLAAVGNCTACHTNPGGKSFAGGLPIP